MAKISIKLLVMVMCSSSEKFKKLERAIKATWGTCAHPGVSVLFYTDNQRTFFKKKKPVLKERDLILPCKDGYDHCTEKTLLAFQFASDNLDFQYIFRTNLGSFVNFEKITRFLADKPKKRYYAGIIGSCQMAMENIRFASGSGYFLSRDLVDLIAAGKNSVDHSIVDDVAIGKFLAERAIPIAKNATRLTFNDNIPVYQVGDKEVAQIDPDLLYHIRLRSTNRDIDIRKMHELFILDSYDH